LETPPLPDLGMPPAAASLAAGSRQVGDVVATGAAILTLAFASGLQAILFLHYFGASDRTDGFFAAYALYIVVAVFSQTLRSTAIPLVSGINRKMSATTFGWAVVGLALVILAACLLGAAPLAQALAPGLTHGGRGVTEASLRVLALGMALQLGSAGLATLLGVAGRLRWVAVSYGAGALAGIAAFLVLRASAREQALAWSTVFAAAVAGGLMLVGDRPRILRPPSATRVLGAGVSLIASSLVPLAPSALYVVTLALASGSGRGEVTLMSYAYMAVAYLAGFTSAAVAMSDMIELAPDQGTAATRVRSSVPRGLRYSLLVAAPALAVAIIVGAPLLHALVPSRLSTGQVGTLRVFIALLSGWLIAAVALTVTLPALFTSGWIGRLNRLLPAMLALHVAASFTARALLGVDGLLAAMTLAPAVFVAVVLALSQPGGVLEFVGALATDIIRVIAIAVLAFAPPAAIAAVITGALASMLAAAVIGALIYLALLRLTYVSEWRMFVSVFVPAGPSRLTPQH
jgi:hypothetical protein